MRLPIVSLRKRLLWAILAPLAIIIALSDFLGYQLAHKTAEAAFDERLNDFVFEALHHVNDDLSTISDELASEAAVSIRNGTGDKLYFSVRDQNGNILAGNDYLPVFVTTPSKQPHFANSTFAHRPVRAAYMRTITPDGDFTITVVETMVNRDRITAKILTAMIFPSLVILLCALLAVYFGVRKGLAPIEQIENEVASRSHLDLREINISSAPHEIRPLLIRLNELFGILRNAAASQQRFLADASHQLRTPLTGLRTQIDLAAHEGRFQNDHGRLDRIIEAIRRIDHLTDRLLTYVQTEPAAAVLHEFAPVNLDDIVGNAASLFLDRALSREIDIGFHANPATVSGISWMLREALANLIDNALRYTPKGGVVTVSCSEKGSSCVLMVEDSGPGVPPGEREKVFERFYRIQGTTSDGCGLGLAIVREIASLHTATIHLEESALGGLRISLIFPAVLHVQLQVAI